MGIEIERKFLVVGESWRSLATGVLYRQGYLCAIAGRTVRVRIAGETGYLTVKGPSQRNARSEYEYVIPQQDAAEMLDQLCERPLIEKIRYRIPWGEVVWEVDEFQGDNQGLILAEVELKEAEQAIQLPDWIGLEVSHDPRYFNSNLARYPFCRWSSP